MSIERLCNNCDQPALGDSWYCKEHSNFMNNEWENAGFTLLQEILAAGVKGKVIIEEPGYEYRLQRRKKAKEMPPIRAGDCVTISSNLALRYVLNDAFADETTIYTKIKPDDRTGFFKSDVSRIYRSGTEIWRRE